MHSTSFVMKKYNVTRRDILEAITEVGIKPFQRVESVDGEMSYVNYYRDDEILEIIKAIDKKYGESAA